MIPIISEIVDRFKENIGGHLQDSAIVGICRELRYDYRDRLLNPVATVHLLLLQVLNGNTAMTHLPHLAKLSFTAAAYCQARMKLPLEILQQLVERIAGTIQQQTQDTLTWFGHRVFLVDGSSFSMPDTAELKARFGYGPRCRPGCGFPVAHMMALFHAGSGMLLKVIAGPLRTHDLSYLVDLHPEIRENDILVGDRAYASYAHFCLILQRGANLLTRMHQHRIADFTPGRKHYPPSEVPLRTGLPKSRWIRCLGVKDQIVEWFKPLQKPAWMSKEQFLSLPASIITRELRYSVETPGFRTHSITLVTTLLDQQAYPAKALAEPYFQRWQIELHFRELKTYMKMDVLHSKTYEGILKELFAFAIVYNLVRTVMLQAANQHSVSPNQISFTDALRWLASITMASSEASILLIHIRPNRFEPRVLKRRGKPYPYMIKPRSELKLAIANQ